MNIRRFAYVLILLVGLITTISAEITFFDNPDNLFIIDPMTTANGTGGAITGQGSDGKIDCEYNWNCTNWSKCLSSGRQIRECINIGDCLDSYQTPATEQSCDYGDLEISELQKRIAPGEPLGKRPLMFVLIPSVVLIVGFMIFYFKKILPKKRMEYKEITFRDNVI